MITWTVVASRNVDVPRPAHCSRFKSSVLYPISYAAYVLLFSLVSIIRAVSWYGNCVCEVERALHRPLSLQPLHLAMKLMHGMARCQTPSPSM
jgi:hypothetical protein